MFRVDSFQLECLICDLFLNSILLFPQKFEFQIFLGKIKIPTGKYSYWVVSDQVIVYSRNLHKYFIRLTNRENDNIGTGGR